MAGSISIVTATLHAETEIRSSVCIENMSVASHRIYEIADK